MRDENRSDILVFAKWVNPYTNKEEDLDIWLPNECIDRNIKGFFKNAYDIDIKDNEKFIDFLEVIGRSPSDLMDFSAFMELCLSDYYETVFYEQDKKEALDDYEMFYSLGEYAEDDEYAE